jgi:transcriptional regulator NrdR family protein
VRFASVYKNFGAADDFRSFLSELKETPTLGEDDD